MMIHTGRLYEFVGEIITIRNEETEDQALWEFWLHRDFERTFAEFRGEIEQSSTNETNEEDLVSIVRQSKDILSFVPPEKG